MSHASREVRRALEIGKAGRLLVTSYRTVWTEIKVVLALKIALRAQLYESIEDAVSRSTTQSKR